MNDQSEQNIGINSCDDIVKDNPDPSLHPPVYNPCGRWLYYIEKPEKKEPSRQTGQSTGKKSHGDQIAHHLIDDDFRAVLLPQDDFGPF